MAKLTGYTQVGDLVGTDNVDSWADLAEDGDSVAIAAVVARRATEVDNEFAQALCDQWSLADLANAPVAKQAAAHRLAYLLYLGQHGSRSSALTETLKLMNDEAKAFLTRMKRGDQKLLNDSGSIITKATKAVKF